MNARSALALTLALAACGGAKIDLGTLPDASAPPDAEEPVKKPDPSDRPPPIPELGPLVDCNREPCGARCALCRPDDPRCKELPGFKSCDAKGQCIPKAPLCPSASGGLEPFYFPCAGMVCGDKCSPCGADDPGCVPPSRPMHCDLNGTCSPQTPLCK